MNVKYIILIMIAVLCVRCGSETKQSRIYACKEYLAIDSASRMMSPDSVRMLAVDLRNQVGVHPTADAYADAYMAWSYNVDSKGDSVIKYAERARLKFLVLSDSLPQSAVYDLANVELLLGYYHLPISSKTAKFYLDQALQKYLKLERTSRIVDVYMYMAELHKNNSEIRESLDYLRKVEMLCDTLVLTSSNDYSWMLGVTTDISYMYHELGDYRQMDNYLDLASTFFDKCDTKSQLYYLQNRARAHLFQNELTLAAYTAERLERLASVVAEYEELTTSYVLRGLALCRLDILDEAKQYQQKAESMASIYGFVLRKEKLLLDGELASAVGDYELAYKILFDSIDNDHRYFERTALLESRKSYYLAKGDYQMIYALEREKQFYKDSLRTNYVYDHENKRIEASRNTQLVLKTEIEHLKGQLYDKSISGVLERVIFSILLVIAVAIIVFYIKNNDRRNKVVVEREYKRLRDDNEMKVELLKKQKDMLQVTNKRISESITYAERIQQSILPSPDLLNEYVAESFVFYSPLDVVSGDFYWFTSKGDYLIVCCADCTGHGVPGAFMSMIATTILKDVCNVVSDDVAPSYLLEQLDTKILAMLAQNRGEMGSAKDGLDIAIVSINLKTKLIRASSARRPVIVIKDQDIITIQGVRRSVGDTEEVFRMRQFVDTEVQLHSGDTIYMYSDGYSDQFGGNDGAKLKNNKVKKFLRAIHDDDMDEQSLTMQELFMQWKGDYPQTDDVLFMGLRL